MPHRPLRFIHDLAFEDLPQRVVEQARLCLIDLLGVALVGRKTPLSRIACDHAVDFFGAGTHASRLLFDGRLASPIGAGLAAAMTIDSLDGHDGHSETKGHIGVTALPALLALADLRRNMSGREFLTCLVLGYEFGTRAGISLHASASDYHTSGAWNALAAAALAARTLPLDARQTREALGIAEYHGPRSQMMRCIDHPTMVKDGSGWGCMAGLSAGFLARKGFTGAPAITVENDESRRHWNDLGERWRILEQYVKPYPVCRWAHPAIDAALALRREHGFSSAQIRAVRVSSFHQAIRLAHARPASTEEAQYSLLWSVAAALASGEVGIDAIMGDNLAHPEVLRLSHAIETTESLEFSARFPQERWASVSVELIDGRRVESGPTRAQGDPDRPLDADAIRSKFRRFAASVCEASLVTELEDQVSELGTRHAPVARFLDLVLSRIRVA